MTRTNTSHVKSIVALLRCALFSDALTDDVFIDDEILSIIQKNALCPIVYDTIATLPIDLYLNDATLMQLEQSSFLMIHDQLISNMALNDIFVRARERNLNVVVLKGVILAGAYPDPAKRRSSDIDLYVSEESFDTFMQLMNDMGYTMTKEEGKGQAGVVEYSLGSSVKIELHRHAAVKLSQERWGVMEKIGLFDDKNFITVNTCGMEITVPEHSRHLIYMIYHMAKHVVQSSGNIRMLCDVALFVNKYVNEIDFSKFHQHIESLGYTTFCDAVFSICNEYFHMASHALRKGAVVQKKRTDELLYEITINPNKSAAAYISYWTAVRFARVRYGSDACKHKHRKITMKEFFATLPNRFIRKFKLKQQLRFANRWNIYRRD